MTTKKIELQFENEKGRVVRFSLNYPEEPVDPELVKEVMDEIIEQDVFKTSGGKLVAKRRARVIEQTVEEIF